MPKLNDSLRDTRKLRIEKAAKTLFIKQGFHGTSTRAIAARAGVSLGNVYNYYYQKVIDAGLNEMFAQLTEPFQPDDLVRFGHAVGSLVSKHSDYWLLMYIDVLEFRNQHFRKMFDGLSKKLQRRFAGHFAELRSADSLCAGADPSVAFTAAYMQFFDYFLVERLFGGNQHFGISDDQVVVKLAEIFSRGVMRPENIRSPLKTPAKQVAHKR